MATPPVMAQTGADISKNLPWESVLRSPVNIQAVEVP
jgi:hypothetical protein